MIWSDFDLLDQASYYPASRIIACRSLFIFTVGQVIDTLAEVAESNLKI